MDERRSDERGSLGLLSASEARSVGGYTSGAPSNVTPTAAGQVIEVEHDTGAISRYTHLSRFSPQLVVGDLVNAGESLGEVGASGVATGPNLHYEVLVDGRPTDPLSDDRLAEAAEREADDTAALERLREARSLLAERLASEFAQTTTERL